MQPIFAQDWGNSLISLLLPCLGWPGRRPLKLVWTHIGLLRQMNGLCLTHTSYSTSRPRQMKLRWPDPPPSFGPSLRLLGLHLNPRPAALFTYLIPTIQDTALHIRLPASTRPPFSLPHNLTSSAGPGSGRRGSPVPRSRCPLRLAITTAVAVSPPVAGPQCYGATPPWRLLRLRTSAALALARSPGH